MRIFFHFCYYLAAGTRHPVNRESSRPHAAARGRCWKEYSTSLFIFAKFGVAGLINTLFGYGIFAGCIAIGLRANIALLITYLVAVPFNYLTTGKFVFSLTNRTTFMKFILAYLFIYCLNICLFHFINLFTTKAFISQALCLPIVVSVSFVVFKFCVFTQKSKLRIDNAGS